MLTRLSIRNIVLIEALDLTFGRGLGVLTGETGAGKSILLDALGLVLGNRAASGLVRGGTDKASVSASFEFAALPQGLAERLDDADIEVEDGEPLIVRRQLRPDGKSKAFVNDQPVSVGLLREMAGFLVELHGQHDDRGLVNPRGHRTLLDRFAGVDGAQLAAAWRAWRSADEALGEARLAVETAKADQDLLLAHLAELTALEPQAGEEARLAAARTDMQKGEKLSGDLEELRHLWEGSDSPLASLRVAARRLDEAVARELAPLKLDAARFRTAVTPLPEDKWGAGGTDAVEFLIATNPGADFAPLTKIASGGELSRFILALKVALAEQGGAATVIFDEIDRGVGGAVASAIGERLARLSSDGQLLAVTHSPQVAARGRTHYMIAKSSQGTVTKTGVVLLDEAGRQEEIARMLSGAEVTPEARAQADRLLEGA